MDIYEYRSEVADAVRSITDAIERVQRVWYNLLKEGTQERLRELGQWGVIKDFDNANKNLMKAQREVIDLYSTLDRIDGDKLSTKQG
jgi:flagellin-specific chaperone FliS